MARPLRVEYAGALYHVMNRGNRRETVFRQQADYEMFLGKLGEACATHQVRVLSYCLMPNHFHLFLRTELPNLSRFMHGLLTSFTVAQNRRDKTVGHVFQGRFKSQVVEANGYFDKLSRYIHLNPIRVQRAENLTVEQKRDVLLAYPWSSFSALIGLTPAEEWLDGAAVLGGFGAVRREQMRAYRLYVEEGLLRDIADPAATLLARSILGSDSFVEWLKREFLLRRSAVPREDTELSALQSGLRLADVVQAVANHYGIAARRLKDRRCREREARQILLYLASCHCRKNRTLSDLSEELHITLPGLTAARDRMARRLRHTPRLQRTAEAIRTAMATPVVDGLDKQESVNIKLKVEG